MKRTLLLSSIALSVSLLLLFASDPGGKEWPMWGGTPDRNMVSPMKGLPTSWDVASKKNVKWVAQLGSQSYGNPVIAGGQVYAGTNNELEIGRATSELQSPCNLVCRLLLEKKK